MNNAARAERRRIVDHAVEIRTEWRDNNPSLIHLNVTIGDKFL